MGKNDLSSWEDFTGSNFLSAIDVKSEDQIFVCVSVELDKENSRPLLNFETGKDGVDKFKFSLNVTNSKFIKDAGVVSPKDAVGKQMTFKKVLVNNPQLNKEVEGLRIRTLK